LFIIYYYSNTKSKDITDSPIPLLHADFNNVEVRDITCSPKRLAFKNEVEYSDLVFDKNDELERSDSSNSIELASCIQDSTTKFPQMSHSVSTGEVKLTPYKITAFFAICFIIGCFTLPIIFYYVDNGDGTDSAQKVYLFVCLFACLLFLPCIHIV